MARERIEILSGPNKGMVLDIVGTMSIGRGPDSGLQVSDLQVSRRHAVIQQSPSGAILRDQGSGNGTYVGDRRVLEYKLSDGDVITVGPVQFKYLAGTPDEEPVAPSGGHVEFEAREDRTIQAAEAASVYQTFFDSARGHSATMEQLREAQARLATVYESTQIISSERNVGKLLGRVMDQLFNLVPAHNGLILLKNAKTGDLRQEYVKTGNGQTKVTISRSIVQRAFEHKEAVITFDAAADERFGAGMSIIAQNITSAMCAPLEHQEETLGVLYVDTRGTTNAFTNADLELMVALARAAAIAIKNAQYLADLQEAYNDTLIVLANSIEMRDHYTVGHTQRVTNFAVEIARRLKWSEEKLEECRMGGILHDVGKIAVSDAVLSKPGRLTDDEYAQMKVHPERGARVMQDVPFLVPLIPYALYHHEKFDGTGYPFGLVGPAIPVEGRVVAVADTYDAMTSNRPYRKGLAQEVAIEEIKRFSGSQFDPECVQALLDCYQDGSLNKIMQNYYEQDGRSIACPFCSTFIRIPENVVAEDIMACAVCHRRVRILVRNDSFFGELIPEAEFEPTSHGRATMV